MKTATSVITFRGLALVGCGPEPEMPVADTAPATEETQSQPNLLLLVADDMGYTDLGAYGSEIRTPNIDGLAEQSIKLTNFHVAPTCAPTRSMILSGTDNHTAGLGSMFGPDVIGGRRRSRDTSSICTSAWRLFRRYCPTRVITPTWPGNGTSASNRTRRRRPADSRDSSY